MQKITLFYQKHCPYCVRAQQYMQELIAENPAYGQIEITRIDELAQPALADQYDYYYVPTYYVGDEKVHEGAADKEAVRKVFALALKEEK